MQIQKYKARIAGTNKEVIGYITEVREYLGNGVYTTGTSYIISVTEKSMPGGTYGTFKVDPDSIEKVGQNNEDIPVIIDFAVHLTGHDRNTIEQMFEDWIK